MPLRLDRALISVSGPDAVGFLDNLLTQDVGADASVRYAALLSPQGKVITDMFVWPGGDTCLLDVDPSRSDDLLRRLSLYKLRANVSLEVVRGTALVNDAPFDDSFADPRLGALGFRSLTNDATLGDADSRAYQSRCIAAGVPDLARDAAPEEVFALEALLEELNGVDFQKGCFVGQENVSRMKRRATTRRKFCPILYDGPAPAFGTVITAGAAELGSVRTGMDGRAIALLRLDRAFDALAAGQALEAAGRPVRLDPPAWLILPQRES